MKRALGSKFSSDLEQKSGGVPSFARLLPRKSERRVLIVSDDRVSPEFVGAVDLFKNDRVVVLSEDPPGGWNLEARGIQHRHVTKRARLVHFARLFGPVDVLVDLSGGKFGTPRQVWDVLFFHLSEGGLYVVQRGADDDEASVALAKFLLELQREQKTRPGGRPARRVELARSVGSISFDSNYVCAEKLGAHRLKLKELNAVRVLNAREGSKVSRVIVTEPGGRVTSSHAPVSHGASVPIEALDTSLAYPARSVRAYDGPVDIGEHCLAFRGNAILPESYRHPFAANPRNPATINVDAEFARVRPEYVPRRTLDGYYYHVDASNAGHFGHILTEVLPRLWGWDIAKKEFPALKVLFRTRYPGEVPPVLEQTLFTAYGIAPEDIVWVSEPVRVGGLVGATPLIHNAAPYSVDPHIREVWDRVSDGLPAASASVVSAEKLFISRHSSRINGEGRTNRECNNVLEVEEVFREHGFAIIYPEDWSVPDQAAMFRNAKVVAGFGGSGLFSLMYCRELANLIVLNQEAYFARNEHLYSLILDCPTDYFWSVPDITVASGGTQLEAYYSSWSFDFDRNGQALDSLLTSLD